MSSHSRLVKSLFLKNLESENASIENFDHAIKSELLSKKEKKRILFNIDEIGTDKLSAHVLCEQEQEEEDDI